MKNILFIKPCQKNAGFNSPHNGLAILGAILNNNGFNVRILDLGFSGEQEDEDIINLINDFKPDVIGITIYTTILKYGMEMIKLIRKLDKTIPIIVGGPHPTFYYETMKEDKRIDYIVKGEAEDIIVDLMNNAKREKECKVIETKIIDIKNIPYPDYKLFYGSEKLEIYPIMTSRGCTAKCSFCASSLFSRCWRSRTPEDCINEIKQAMKQFNLHKVLIHDDSPASNKERFKEFLRLYNKEIKLDLFIINFRADCIDDELLKLLKEANIKQIAIGVESANPEVFYNISKGETLEQISEACRLIKKHRFKLILSFIIGLPKDNYERVKESIRFAKINKADEVSLNLISPYNFTKVRQQLEEEGAKIYEESDFAPQPMEDFICSTPIVETKDFSIFEREKSFYLFLLEMGDFRLKISKIFKIYKTCKKYGLTREFYFWIPRGVIREEKVFIEKANKFFILYKSTGLRNTIKTIKQKSK